MKLSLRANLLSILLLLGLGIFSSCSKNEELVCRETVNVDTTKVKVKFTRLEQQLIGKADKEKVKAFLAANPELASQFFGLGKIPEDTVVNDLLRLIDSPYSDTMLQNTQTVFKDFGKFEAETKRAWAHLKYYYPQHPDPKFYTFITGFSQDIFLSDSVIMLSLESYLGKEGRYEVPFMPKYIARRMRPDFMVPNMMLYLSAKYTESDILDATMLAEMIKWGKTYYFMEKMMPCTPDSLIIGYTENELKTCNEGLAGLWSYFVRGNLLYNSEHTIISKFCGERPFTNEIGNNVPGRVGRFLGWLIVRKYAIESKATLPEIMAETDAKKILSISKFKPV